MAWVVIDVASGPGRSNRGLLGGGFFVALSGHFGRGDDFAVGVALGVAEEFVEVLHAFCVAHVFEDVGLFVDFFAGGADVIEVAFPEAVGA